MSIRDTRTKLAFRLLVALLPFPFFSLFLLSDRPPTVVHVRRVGSTYARAAYTYTELQQVRTSA